LICADNLADGAGLVWVRENAGAEPNVKTKESTATITMKTIATTRPLLRSGAGRMYTQPLCCTWIVSSERRDARSLDPYLCPVVLFSAFLSVGLIGAIMLLVEGKLDQKSYLALMRFYYKGLFSVWRKMPEGKILPDAAPPTDEPEALRK